MPQWGYTAWMFVVLLPAMAFASWSDCRRHRIPNQLNLAIALSGLAFQLMFHGWNGVVGGLAGLGVGLGLLTIVWLMNGMGAGDVKFMAALGVWLGPNLTLHAVIAALLVGGVLALVQLAARRNWSETWANFGLLAVKVSSVRSAFGEFASARQLARSSSLMPYAVPLSLGTVFVLVHEHAGWWGVL